MHPGLPVPPFPKATEELQKEFKLSVDKVEIVIAWMKENECLWNNRVTTAILLRYPLLHLHLVGI